MSLAINLHQLQEGNVSLTGELPPAALDVEGLDELAHFEKPLKYDLEASLMDNAVFVEGSWEIPVTLECARCLKRFTQMISADDWACHLPLEGEEAVPIQDETVDLTSPLREDIVLALPQHPVCSEGCTGLSSARLKTEKESGPAAELSSGAWAELDKLKL
jgi:uncharacterized protein